MTNEWTIQERDGQGESLIVGPHWQFGSMAICRAPKLMTTEEWRPWARMLVTTPRMLLVLKEALRQSGCVGKLCPHQWHEDARAIIAEIEGVRP